MGRIQIHDNYRATLDGVAHTFQASTDRQAWYLAYEWSEGELLDSLVEIDEFGVAIRELLTDGYGDTIRELLKEEDD